MAEENNYKEKYFNEKFNNIESKIDNLSILIHQQLNDHETRIRSNEKQLRENKEIMNIKSKIHEIETTQKNCPVYELEHKHEQLQNELQTINVLLKKPKLVFRIIIGGVVLALISILASLGSVYNLAESLLSI